MSAKVTFMVQRGSLSGKSFTYDGKESLIIGRQYDCAIVLPESTVSRYHCLIDIAPPSVMVRDFGSLNGTYLNGEIIGRRDAGVSAEEARQTRGEEFSLNHGDRLGIGTDCELSLEMKIQPFCADCFSDIDDASFTRPDGLPICPACHKKRGNEKESGEKRKAGRASKGNEQQRRQNRNCEICGNVLPENVSSYICEPCRNDPQQLLLYLMQQARHDPGEAKEIAGFRKIKMLGEGGMGQAWLVEEDATGMQLVMKLVLPKAAADKKSIEMFLREAHFVCQMDHKNIVKHYRCGQSGDTCFILMEYCDGRSVDSMIERHGGKLSLDKATDIILQVLDGLIYAHKTTVSVKLKGGDVVTANGIVHRDFKPGNIFMTGVGKNFTAKIADFGLAKAFETSGLSGHTRTGQVAGTPIFMPRQQIINYKESKPAVDVWAAAASYYYMLTGKPPKDFASGRDAFAVALANTAVPIRKRNSAISKKLAAVIDQALIEKPDIGVKSAAELKKMIEGAI